MPIFSIDSLYYEIDGDGVIIDNMVGGYKVTEYLIGLGHTKIGYVGTLDNTPSIDDRYMGYCKVLLLHGITPNAEWLIGDRNEESLVKEAEQFTLPTKNKMPTAFFCNCDYVAQLFIDKLKMSGYRVPEDISVVGFDNYLPQIPEAMELTTYEVDIEEIAAVAVANIKKCMEREGGKPKTYVIRGRVIERKSAKAL